MQAKQKQSQFLKICVTYFFGRKISGEKQANTNLTWKANPKRKGSPSRQRPQPACLGKARSGRTEPQCHRVRAGTAGGEAAAVSARARSAAALRSTHREPGVPPRRGRHSLSRAGQSGTQKSPGVLLSALTPTSPARRTVAFREAQPHPFPTPRFQPAW